MHMLYRDISPSNCSAGQAGAERAMSRDRHLSAGLEVRPKRGPLQSQYSTLATPLHPQHQQRQWMPTCSILCADKVSLCFRFFLCCSCLCVCWAAGGAITDYYYYCRIFIFTGGVNNGVVRTSRVKRQ